MKSRSLFSPRFRRKKKRKITKERSQCHNRLQIHENAFAAQSGEDSLRASHLKGGGAHVCYLQNEEKRRGKGRDFTTKGFRFVTLFSLLSRFSSASQSQNSFQATVLGTHMYTFGGCRPAAAYEATRSGPRVERVSEKNYADTLTR